MGREIGLNRIDFYDDGSKAIVRDDDYSICGRTDFTSDIAGLFYNAAEKNIYFLVVSYDRDEIETNRIYLTQVEVEDKYWCDKEFEMQWAYVDKALLQEIINSHMIKDKTELYRERTMLDDARIARQNCTNLKDFTDFCDFIDNLQKHLNEYFEEAANFNKGLQRIEDKIKNDRWTETTQPNKITRSAVLISLSE